MKTFLSLICGFWINAITFLDAQTTSSTFDSIWAVKFQNAIENGIDLGGVHGGSVAVYFPGEGTYIGVVGDSEDGVPITSDMQFCIGSNTKLFTSVILLKLQEMGLLSVDDPINAWLPEFPNINGSATIRQLLSHQSGIRDYLGDFSQEQFDHFLIESDSIFSPESIISTVGPPYFLPGEGYRTSNTNYILAGMIIEAVTGKSYDENLHEFILDPLDLDSTFLAVYEEPNGNVASGWYAGVNIGNDPMTAINSLNWASGGIFSTGREMTEWFDQLFNRKSILNQSSLDQLLDIEPSSFYGLGISKDFYYPEVDHYVHFGNNSELLTFSGYNTCMGYDINRGGIVCVMVNGEDSLNYPVYNILIPILGAYHDDFLKKPVDAGIYAIQAPVLNECYEEIFPVVSLQNYGTTALTSVSIHYHFDDGPLHTYHWSGNLLTDEFHYIILPDTILDGGPHVFTCYTSNPNGVTDVFTFNDRKESRFVVKGSLPSSLFEGFEGDDFPPAGWVNGLNATLNWARTELSPLNGRGCALKNNFWDNTFRSYDLELPALNISSVENPVLSFNYAYTYYPGDYDSFEVLASTECIANSQTIFFKEGPQFATAPPVIYPFIPGKHQWKQINVDLSGFNGEIWLKFRDYNGWGNNLFIDDVRIGEGCPIPSDLSATDVAGTSARLSWKYSGVASVYNIYYQVAGSDVWIQITLSGDSESFTLNDLVPGTGYNWYVTADCNFGTSPESEVDFFSTSFTGTNDSFNDIGLQLSPNPASSIVSVMFTPKKSSDFYFRFKAVTGATLQDWKADAIIGPYIHKIDISTYSPGLYILEIESNYGTWIEKLMIQ